MYRTIISILLLSGCGTSLGFLRDSTTSQNFQYSLDLKEVSMQRTVSASVETKTILCIVPTDGDPPYATAMEKLYSRAKLKTNEVLINIREDKRILTYLIYCKNRLTISADVYRLGKAAVLEQETASKPVADSKKPAAPAKPKPPKKKDLCKEAYWKCMEYCGTRGCGRKCVHDQKECYSKGG